jgi:hypothetical protein
MSTASKGFLPIGILRQGGRISALVIQTLRWGLVAERNENRTESIAERLEFAIIVRIDISYLTDSRLGCIPKL